MGLRIFADHCVSKYVIEVLRAAGHDVMRLREHLPVDAPDASVLAKAQDLSALLLSLNGDFADIVRYPPSQYLGIVALQIRNHPEVTAQVVDKLKTYTVEARHPDGNLGARCFVSYTVICRKLMLLCLPR